MTKLLTAPYDGESLECVFGNEGGGALDGDADAGRTLRLSAQMVDGNIYLEQHKEPPRYV